MRLSAFAVIAASAALAHVSAAPAPIRLLIISSSVEKASPLNGIRFGHAVSAMHNDEGDRELLNGLPVPPVEGFPISPDANLVPLKRFRHRPGCRGKKGSAAIVMHRIKIKAIKIGNCFRKALGWPLIEVEHHRHHHHHHHHGQPPHDEKDKHEEDGLVGILPFPHDNWVGGMAHGHPGDELEHKEHRHFYKHHGSFLSRLHHSLMNLGHWEGRAVAFVIGCGIGVLIRMFWVLAIVSYRTCRGHRDDGSVPFAVMEEYESDDETIIFVPSAKVEPPKYVYPVDEKVESD